MFWSDPRAHRILVACFVLCLGVACEATRQIGTDVAYELNPFGSTDLTVHAVSVHGPYLLAELSGRGERARFLAPPSEPCVALLVPEKRLVYGKSGTFGKVSDGGTRCDLYGVASLEVWRDRQPRKRGGLVPRSAARYTLLARDDAYLLVRGRFALANKVAIPGAYDLVAMLPNDPVCREAVERGEASLEFRPAGPSVYRLTVGSSFCPVEGFAIPLAP